jgi:SOS response regulatory protein OraA/RecX
MRDHSERELQTKLGRFFEKPILLEAIEEARRRNYLKPPEDLAQSVTARLLESRKSSGHIRNYLRRKGLPAVPVDRELELANAKDYVERRFGTDPMDGITKKKAARALLARGFSQSVVMSILYGK